MILRPRQVEFTDKCLAALEEHGNTLGVAPTGAGKTLMLSSVISHFDNALFLQHRDELVDQNFKTFKKINPTTPTDFFTADRKVFLERGVTFAMVQTLMRQNNLERIKSVDLLAIDECFVRGTLVDKTPIELLRAGDFVNSFNHDLGRVEKKRVVRVFKNKQRGDLLKIYFKNTPPLICTPGHPVFSKLENKYINASELTCGDMVLTITAYGMLHLLKNYTQSYQASKIQIKKAWKSLLRKILLYTILQKDKCDNNGKNKSQVCIKENEGKQSDEKCGDESQGVYISSCNGMEANNSGWKWMHCPAASLTSSIYSWLGFGGICKYRNAHEGNAVLLQDRHWKFRFKDWDRGGWGQSWCPSEKKSRPKKNQVSRIERVDYFEVQKQGSDNKFARMCPDGFVYNIEVEDNNNYFANGVLVHNCHHSSADGYQRILNRCKEINPDVKVFGVTATPVRGDRKALKETFSNIADVITLKELIHSGHLVRPRTFVVDCGLQEDLKKVRITAGDFDQDAVAEIMDKVAVNDKVVEEWKKLAHDRSTVIFCSTVEHARHVTHAFKEAGISAELVWGDMPGHERKAVLHRLETFETQVVVNVAVLTEGFDFQPLSCVVLLRPCSFKSTMMQMIGRGLRKVDQDRYPGVVKDNCIILDFGYSILTHGNLDVDANLEPERKKIKCEGCGEIIYAYYDECPYCGTPVPKQSSESGGEAEPKGELDHFILTEVELLEMSPFRWEDLWDGSVTIANAITAWACCVLYNGRWVAIGGNQEKGSTHVLENSSERIQALSTADDYLREHGDQDACSKTRSWMSMPASDKQAELIGLGPMDAFGTNRYRASCLITWGFNQRKIRSLVETYGSKKAA